MWMVRNNIERRTRSESHSGKFHPNWGKKRSRDFLEKVSGANSYLWKGGKTPLIKHLRTITKYKDWRKLVYERDNYTCQWCGDNKGGNLNADHIKSLSLIIHENNITNIQEAKECDELWDTDNGRTLCEECHKKTDTFGKKATKRVINE